MHTHTPTVRAHMQIMCLVIECDPTSITKPSAVFVSVVQGMCERLTDITGALAQRLKLTRAPLINKYAYTQPVIHINTGHQS